MPFYWCVVEAIGSVYDTRTQAGEHTGTSRRDDHGISHIIKNTHNKNKTKESHRFTAVFLEIILIIILKIARPLVNSYDSIHLSTVSSHRDSLI